MRGHFTAVERQYGYNALYRCGRKNMASRNGRMRIFLPLQVYAATRLSQTPSRRAQTGRDVNPCQILRPWHGRICALLPRPEPREHGCQTLGREAHKLQTLLICCSPVIQCVTQCAAAMQVFDGPVAPRRKRHAVCQNPVGMLNHNGEGPFHARLQVGSSQIPELGGSQPVKRV
jgi:hypothetical protein